MNFVELIDRLRVSVKNPDETDKPKLLLGQYINDGYRDVFGKYPMHQNRKICTFDTVYNIAKYQLPPDISAVFSISNRTTGRKLRKAGDNKAIDRLDNRPTRPQFYVRYRNYLRLVPVPDGIYTIAVFYKFIPMLLVNDTDIPQLPEDWHIAIMFRAKWYYYFDTGDVMQMTAADNAFKLWAMDKPSEIDDETVDADWSVERPEQRHQAIGGRGYRYDDGTFDYGNWG